MRVDFVVSNSVLKEMVLQIIEAIRDGAVTLSWKRSESGIQTEVKKVGLGRQTA